MKAGDQKQKREAGRDAIQVVMMSDLLTLEPTHKLVSWDDAWSSSQVWATKSPIGLPFQDLYVSYIYIVQLKWESN